ncbi:acetyl/propionyl-CoA carboxylase subuit alpha [Flexivirga endophytica]|uniref:Acetyl/propionyl-CoA carboxylase subuit alpha n=1 Tax=Flexivirga endophytica TaxID=1849103 RepID=A0A916WT35_9MICO|nr:biotin carboxylase N-terminal domain-containing protein [Flexivirga endophytica]GGB27165.1 acetyl/propionyl-CoA carboxylase subuit alpha [Flexivirga endophytica]GHB55661.1 acetyl/propionyl-CoA carboxylase subuit alpha [Flexivirga endophytica]
MTASTTIRRLLVANRGEIARRIFRTCRTLGIETVAVHSDPDTDGLHVRDADFAVRLPGAAASETYLQVDAIVAAATQSGCDAVHPGYGFLSENADFAAAVIAAGLTWVGPRPETIAAMGSKMEAKAIMRSAGVPTLDVDPNSADADAFPLLVKASAGGGGRGMRVVRSADRLETELAAARAEAHSTFGDETVFVEPYLPTARHVEVQVVADQHGTCWIVGDRDCSIQRRHQKVVEEAPAPHLTDAVRDRLHDAARSAVRAVDYVGAGTVEFLVHGDDVFFLEMNTRLQVEHPVTECVTGVDLVAEQLLVAEGHPLAERDFTPHGHSVEVRLYAEDPARDWAPQDGEIAEFSFKATYFDRPTNFGVRVDSAVGAGSTVGIHYDPMLAKIIAWAPDRTSACRMLADALRRCRIHGIATNARLLRAILRDPDFLAARMHTSLLDERLAGWLQSGRPDLTGAAGAAALADAAAASSEGVVQQRIPTAWRNAPSADRTRRYRAGSEEIEVGYRSVRGRLQLAAGELETIRVTPDEVLLRSGNVTSSYRVSRRGTTTFVDGPDGGTDLEQVPRFTAPESDVAGSLLAPMPGVVTAVDVDTGAVVSAGQQLLVLEAMKMQHTITAPADGVVGSLSVAVGDQVAAGTVLAVIDESSSEH